jgi:hypothetical protein
MPPAAKDVLNSPTYWFAVMEGAKKRGDFLLAHQALSELRRLGVHVRFLPPGPRPRRGRGGPDHAA